MTATIALPTETFNINTLTRLAERDQLVKADRLSLYKVAANCGEPFSIHGGIYDFWATFDRTIFNRQLSPVLIVIGVTEHSGCLGQCTPVAGQSRITLHQACYRPADTPTDRAEIKAGIEPTRWGIPKRWMGEEFLAHVLLHEMQHQAQADLGIRKPGEDAHNGRSWSDLCNHSAKYLGLADKVFFPEYRRRKTSSSDGKHRSNIWVPINADEAPKGVRIASQQETKAFPYGSFIHEGLAEERYGS